MGSDFFQSQYGNYQDLPFWRHREFGRPMDLMYDARLAMNPSYRRLAQEVAKAPKLKVLLTGVEVPSRRSDLEQVFRTMAESRHEVTTRAATLHEGKGKFQNINLALQEMDLNGYDWLVVLDDDVALPPNFLDTFLYLADRAELKICMPAHRFYSYQSYAVTQRRWNSLVRTTRFVECGPITAFRRDVFAHVLPFPELRWAWGTDLAWSEHGKRQSFQIGIVDGAPIAHLRPVAASYESRDARLEGEAYLGGMGVNITRQEALQTGVIYKGLNPDGTGRGRT
ncbi:glycosyltransferase [Granulicella sp. dw_53]|uniref:glycosyltransferase n=1 Tax=Granulicella sp. dw_53 TaxID=2719792 RepID=UPI001BD6D80A|nr:glycosyltransferase [Granulicella sp. dw_53]